MKILIAGVDGYLGWTLAQHLARRGHAVSGIDAFRRRRWVAETGSASAIPILPMAERLPAFAAACGRPLDFTQGDLTDLDTVSSLLRRVRPDCIVHLGEMPSAPFSMIDARHAVETHRNNLSGTLNLLFAMREACPEAHLLKLGTLGEYGTPNVDIPEGFFEVEFRGRRDRLPFPRQPGSFYHLTKVHDSHNIAFACRAWGLRSTDIMQGVVFGTRVPDVAQDPALATRFDFDQCFGTAINRFCAQAVIGMPLTVYGAGTQRRGFLPLRDSIACFTLSIENPPEAGEYRVFNQLESTYAIGELAELVRDAGRRTGLEVRVDHLDNPRVEASEHHFRVDRDRLVALGYQPTTDIEGEVAAMLVDLTPHASRIRRHRAAIRPDIDWRRGQAAPAGVPFRAAS